MSYASFKIRFVYNTSAVSLKLTLKWLEVLHESPYNNDNNDNNNNRNLASENSCFSSLPAAGDVSRGGKSATQRQKFHTDDVKTVRNRVRSADWSTG